jgi:phosphoribosylamine--glycine ligase
MLEGSKAFSKDFLRRHNIPGPDYRVFTDIKAAKDYVSQRTIPIVIKADGLAAGKGVVIAHTIAEANDAIDGMLSGDRFAGAGKRIVIEEFMQGREVSFIVLSDGRNVLPLASSQDYTTRDDGGTGPNTGGMGACSPAPIVTDAMHEHIMQDIIQPTIGGMAEEDKPYVGFLYAGLMIADDGSAGVLEYNCRFGDPETQPIMLRLQSDLLTLCDAALDGQLDRVTAEWCPDAAVGVVLASGGYPAGSSNGDVISGLMQDETEGIKIFHAGTRQQNGDIVTAGGRVLCVTALGKDIEQARESAYQTVAKISFQDMFYRRDIGQQVIHDTTAYIDGQ